MDDSLKGVLITSVIIIIFITAILNFIILFPQEQGVNFAGQNGSGYLTIQNNATPSTTNSSLNSLSNSTNNAFNTWDVTVGFMGSNTMKQSQIGIGTSITQIFSSLSTISALLFTANSPIFLIIGILSTLAGIVIVYYVYQFVRTGR